MTPHDAIPDPDLVADALAGDAGAFRALVERHQQDVFRLIRGVVPRSSDHDDLAQDTFVRAYAALPQYDAHRGSFTVWLLTIARRLCYNARARRRPAVGAALPDATSDQPPDERLLAAERRAALHAALDALPFAQRSCIVLRHVLGMTYAAIADIEQIDCGTVKSRIARARAALRDHVDCDRSPR